MMKSNGMQVKAQKAGILLLSLMLTAMSGCGNPTTVDSEVVDTRRIWAGVRYQARGNGVTRVNVELNEGSSSGNNLSLSANERLEVNANGTIIRLQEDQDLLDVDYEGTIPTDASSTPLVLTLFRADGSIVNGTRVDLPTTLDITSPENNQSMTVGDVVSLEWTPAIGGTIELATVTQCSGTTRADFRDISDTGALTIDTGTLPGVLDPAVDRNQGCRLIIDLTRERRGTLDPQFRGGGFVVATQTRSVEATLSFP